MHHPGYCSHRTCLLATTLFAVSPAAQTLELISGAQLVERCRVSMENLHGTGGQYCNAYLRGFVDGSPLVSIQDSRASESFTQRAVRTRLGRSVPVRPAYCIASGTSVQDLAAQLLTHARESPADVSADASALVYSMLARYHPCPRRG